MYTLILDSEIIVFDWNNHDFNVLLTVDLLNDTYINFDIVGTIQASLLLFVIFSSFSR